MARSDSARSASLEDAHGRRVSGNDGIDTTRLDQLSRQFYLVHDDLSMTIKNKRTLGVGQ